MLEMQACLEKEMRKSERELRVLAREYGVSLQAGSKHWKLVRDGSPVTIAPKTPSDWRGIRNLKASLARASA